MTQNGETKLFQVFEDHNTNTDAKIPPDRVIDLVDEICRVAESDDSLSKVKVFMDTFNQPVANKFAIPDFKTCLFRLGLDLEETIELATACGADVLSNFGIVLAKKAEEIRDFVEKEREKLVPNRVEALDALLDKRYINDGTVHAFGGRYIFDEGFQLVHESNMSKACNTDTEAIDTIISYAEKGITVISQPKEDKFLIIKQSNDEDNGKVLKSINYKPVNLQPLLANKLLTE